MPHAVERRANTAGNARGPGSALADTLLERLTGTYAQAADPVRAEAMAAYVKDVAPFLGVPTPLRRRHPDFFPRKAIGRALREYAKTYHAAVRAFVEAERGSPSPLSVREALKNL
ncbi:DNA alkylation repair protein [Streptomyces sp. NPDC001717]|uniref:DNA alkylation repair protein n=1 Tax=Streptomyces sp. NPDC001717 TaxID=3364604 RepID=UPI0036A3FE85